jgi:TRAP transporter TAXI family solute receptor
LILSIIVVLVVAFTLGCTSPATSPGAPTTKPVSQYTLLTGGTSGTYYPIGVSIANILNNASIGMKITAVTTGASVENCRRIASKEDNFAMVQNDVMRAAYDGTKFFNTSNKNLRAVAALYPETIQVIVLKDSGINSISDLKGKRVIVGAAGSGTEFNALEILAAYGINKSDITVDNNALGTATDRLKNGQADAAFWSGGAPTAGITNLATSKDVKILPISGAVADKLINQSPYYTKKTLPADMYKGMDAPVETLDVIAWLITYQDMSDNDVYNLLSTMYNNTDTLKNSHAMASYIKPEYGYTGATIPMHPGATKYFNEKGIKAP